MAITLVACELGGGLGHITQLLPLALRLNSAGHRVALTLRNVDCAAQLADVSGITVYQSPIARPAFRATVSTARTFAHVLWNNSYSEPGELRFLVDEWNKLLDGIRPDLIVFDHAPTALLAARGRNVRRVVLGNGFSCPADCSPLPDLRHWLRSDAERLAQDEGRILENMNRVLEDRGGKALERITDLFREVDDTFLTTLREFDYYPLRQGARYRGPWSFPGGASPVWPVGGGKRIYAYLRPFPRLPMILNSLRVTGCPTVVFGNLDQNIQDCYGAPNIRFETNRLDLRTVVAECDLAVLNAGHASTLQFLLAGKPILQAPIFLEEVITAMNTARIGAGVIAFPRGEDRTVEQLGELLSNPRYTNAARQYAGRYAKFSAEAEIEEAVQRLHELASR
jgi:hypothetical protein